MEIAIIILSSTRHRHLAEQLILPQIIPAFTILMWKFYCWLYVQVMALKRNSPRYLYHRQFPRLAVRGTIPADPPAHRFRPRPVRRFVTPNTQRHVR